MKKIFLSVQDFAIPSPLTGSIELNSGMGLGSYALERGMEIHKATQEIRKSEYPHYTAEIRTQFETTLGGYTFQIDGRMDGFFDQGEPHIEEIKSGFNIYDLRKQLLEKGLNHPYVLQLMTYGYFQFKKPMLNLRSRFTSSPPGTVKPSTLSRASITRLTSSGSSEGSRNWSRKQNAQKPGPSAEKI